ncbi:DUF5708 family protein [Streptomyces sp. NBC_01092]|uniref:DUF5708 family protein n=1 Tax=Streptomyces sp. NBC_01092 TaxID=2903748 RepID=UPI00386EA694|nr:DUF5708 family protein [Streptomyces sp. NBC_01092]
MAPASKNIVEGAVCAVIGIALGLFTEDVHIPVFTLTKVGVVLIAIGGIQLLYGVYQAFSARSVE